MDQEVAKTLGELELKLQKLERELTSIGGHRTPAERLDAPAEPLDAPLDAPGKLIDEAVERQSIELADLVRFRDKLARTMDELVDEYSRLLSLKPPSRPRSDA